MNDYERTDTDPRLERRGEVPGVDTGPDEVEIYDRPETATTGADAGTGMGLWVGLLVLIVVAALVVLLLLFLF